VLKSTNTYSAEPLREARAQHMTIMITATATMMVSATAPPAAPETITMTCSSSLLSSVESTVVVSEEIGMSREVSKCGFSLNSVYL